MAVIDSVRSSMTRYINENPVSIVVEKYVLKDNGYGIKIPNMSVPPTVVTLGIGRVVRRRLPDPIVTDAISPYDYNDVFYLLVSYDASWLRRGLIFDYNSQRFRTLLVENRVMFGKVTYRLCDLEQVTSTDGGVLYE